MATDKRGKGSAANSEQPIDTSAGWRPPVGSQKIELGEFFNFDTAGQTVIGRLQRTTERPDPVNKDKIMRALVLSPAIVYQPGSKAEAFKTLAVGHSAHLQLLIDNPEKELGSAFAISLTGKRKSDAGKNPSKQFDLYKLTPAQFENEIKIVAGKHAPELLAGTAYSEEEPF